MKKILFIFTAILSWFLPGLVLAQHTVTTEVGQVANIAEYVSRILNTFLIPILGGLALIMVIYAGYIYMTSQGNPEALGRAKDILIGVVVGIVLLFTIEIIIRQIGLQ